MALHTLSDCFAHSVAYRDSKGIYHHLDHPKPICKNPQNGWADDTKQISQRFADAGDAVKCSLDKYDKSGNATGNYEEYRVVVHQHIEYYMKSLYDFVYKMDTKGAKQFKSVSY